MHDIRINKKANVLLCIIRGKLDSAEAEEYVSKLKAAADELDEGFAVISDLTEFTPTDDGVRDILHGGTEYVFSRGVGRVVRVVTESVTSKVGNIQLNRSARQLGYQAEIVHSMAEARQLLNL